jgi:hypothetical protein
MRNLYQVSLPVSLLRPGSSTTQIFVGDITSGSNESEKKARLLVEQVPRVGA